MSNGAITFDAFVAELFWCTAYAFASHYDHLERTPPPEGSSETDVHVVDFEAAGLRDAFHVFEWSLDRLRRQSPDDWPEGLPRPTSVSPKDAREAAGTAGCLFACAFALLHEVAHATLGHDESAPDLERDADYFAADWLVAGNTGSGLSMRLGIATAMLVFAINEDLRGHVSPTHPRAAERLVNTLDRSGADENDRIWLFVWSALKVHLDNVLPTPPAVSLVGSRRDRVENLIAVLVGRLRS